MIAQVFEPFSGGHHTKYVAFMLPALVRLLDEGRLERVILTTTSRHRESPFFADSLSQYASKVVFDVVAAGDIYDRGHEVSAMLLDSLERNRPDYVVFTSADNGALTLALRCLVRSRFRARDVTSVGILHYGFHEPARGVRDRLQDGVHRFSRRFSPWSEVHVVNPQLYDFIRRRAGWAQRRLRLLPDPVEPRAPVAKVRAREALGIPVDGTYLAAVGKSNSTKAIPDLLAAFRAARLHPSAVCCWRAARTPRFGN